MNYYADSKKLSALKQKANKLPLSSGVYIMKDKSGKIIYIGKAKALKNRVTQYFGSGSAHSEKVRKMVSLVDDFEYIICDSEYEALVLECSLIKQHQPKYNILLKDDKGYHYIKITNEKWPRFKFSNTIDNDGEYLGPYYSAFIAKQTLEAVEKIFKLPDCNRSFDKYSKPCLNFHIGRCDAPCRGKIELKSYLETVSAAREYIKNRGAKDLLKDLNEKMSEAAKNLDFEYAAKLRDRIKAINSMQQKQKVVMCTHKKQDVFASAFMGETACVSLLIFRNNRLTDKKHYILEGFTDKNSLYSEFLTRYYMNETDIPSRILLDDDFSEKELTEQYLSEKTGKKVSLIIPKAGEPKAIALMCLKNAADNLALNTRYTASSTASLNEIQKLLGLNTVPRYIEAYDISHTAGEENVAGMVVFKDAVPYKQGYKRFKIKGFLGADDYRSMAEVLERRFSEYKIGAENGFDTLPDLILLDGGKGQVSAVEPILQKYNLNIPLFGMVKDSKHRTRAITGNGGDISIKANQSAYTLITKIQDEVHRFAIGYHRKRRTDKMLNSELNSIEGIGKQKANALLKHFKTLKAIKAASVTELTMADGISEGLAQKIYSKFHS